MEHPDLSPREAIFVREYMVDLNGTAAWTRAGFTDNVGSAGTQASRVLQKLEVRIAINKELDARAERTDITAEKVLQMWWDIATADPNQLVHNRVWACRHCHGPDFKYQWKSIEEWASAVEASLRAHEAAVLRWAEIKEPRPPQPELRMPTNGGGFEFNPHLGPVKACPCCDGDGITETIVKDTRTLRRPERLLYAGVKKTKDGIEVKMHDQDKAREMIARHLGMLNDKLQLSMPGGLGVYTVDDLSALSVDELKAIEQAVVKVEAGRAST